MKRFAGVVLSAAAAVFAADNLALWSKYKDIAVNTKTSGAAVAGDVSKFPLLVRLDSVNAADIFAQASAGGADIRFANTAGAPKPFEIEYWNATTRQAAIWVLADSVKGNDSVASLRIYWGNSSALGASNGHAVFDTANGYVGAWHLGNSAGTSPRPASVAGAPAAVLRNYQTGDGPVPGIIGMADTLRGGGTGLDADVNMLNYIELGRNAAGQDNNYAGFRNFTTGLSYSIWFNSANPPAAFSRLLNLASNEAGAGDGDAERIALMGNQNQQNATPNFAVRLGGSTLNTPAGAYAANTWVHVFVTQAADGAVVVYKDGASLFTGTANMSAEVDRNYSYLGRSLNGNALYQGKFDNLTLAKVARSAAFVKLSYETQKAAAAAVVLGATQTQTVTPVALAQFAYKSAAPAADTFAFLTGNAVAAAPSFTGGPVDSFKVVSGTLPAGLTLAKATGLLSGTPTAVAAASDVVIRAWGRASAADSVSRTVRIATFAPAALTYAPDSADYNINTAITPLNPTYTGSTATFTVSPALPAGLSLNATTGVISGTPTAATARASYTVKAKTAIDSATKVLRLAVIDPTSIHGNAGMPASGFSAEATSRGIRFQVAAAAGDRTTLALFDMFGREVFATSFTGSSLVWNGVGGNGRHAPAGLYVARVKIRGEQGVRSVSAHKVLLAR